MQGKISAQQGEGGGAYERLQREMSSAAGASPKGGVSGGILPQKILKKWVI